jgi:glycosyltransferase involved in cell wall biosynthesis
MDLDKQLIGLLVDELRLSGATVLAEMAASQPSFSVALRELLQRGALVVLDEFQRLLDSSARPLDPLATNLQRIAKRASDSGCVWLVSSREIDPVWTEPFYAALLEAPSELADLKRIVLSNVATADAEQRFVEDRRLEVVRRLGANPRALRLLGTLLRRYSLEELLGPQKDVPEAPTDPHLTEQIEQSLLTKAKAGLSNAADVLLRELTVLREPAQWELLEEIGSHLGDVRALSHELRDRYLLDVGSNRYVLHPLVREIAGPQLRRDELTWRAAHTSAGRWYARLLNVSDRSRVNVAKFALHLAGARFHLIEAQRPDELREAIRGIENYIEQMYGWTARNPTSNAERDAQISLLDIYLIESGPAGVEFHFAKLLKDGGSLPDFSKALIHAQRATLNQDFSTPWVLWIQLTRDVEGLEAGVVAARTAAEHVAPNKGLFSIYQLLGAFLCHLGRPEDAVDVLLVGAECSEGSEERLIEEALLFSAAENSTFLLERILDWVRTRIGFEQKVAIANVLLCEHRGDWRDAAETARHWRNIYPDYLILAMHEAFCWLGVGETQRSQEAFDRFEWRSPTRYQRNFATNWLKALIALHRADLDIAYHLANLFHDASEPTSAVGLHAVLLREWDNRVATIGQSSAAGVFPILPAIVTGLHFNVQRPQYGPPVLSQHRVQSEPSIGGSRDRLHVLTVGTEWHSGHGGLSTFNRQFCRAIADAGAEVVCLVLRATPEDRQNAGNVTLVEAIRAPGQQEREALSRRPRLPDGFDPDIIIGHGRVTGPAAQALAEDHFPEAKRLHFVHMAPDEIEWFKLDREDDVGLRAEDRTLIELELGRGSGLVVAVGPRLYERYLRDFSAYNLALPRRFDPGFDTEIVAARAPPPGAPWSILILGRLEDYYLKGVDIAAKAVGLTASRRQSTATVLELMVRGARADTSAKLQAQIRDWSGSRAFSIVVRPFTTNTESLDADMRRASLVLMPSRAEGFGLVGLEAIVAGIPVLVSNQSGLGQLLHEVLGHEQANRIVVPITGDFEDDCEGWARAIEGILRDREAAFGRASEVSTLLSRQKPWVAAISGLLTQITELRARNTPGRVL